MNIHITIKNIKISFASKTCDKSDLFGRGFLLTFKPYPTIKFGELKIDWLMGFWIFSNPLSLLFKYLQTRLKLTKISTIKGKLLILTVFKIIYGT